MKTEDRYAHYDNEEYDGPTELEEAAASWRWRTVRRVGGSDLSPQGSRPNIIGTPRHAKHRGGRIQGVTIK